MYSGSEIKYSDRKECSTEKVNLIIYYSEVEI